MNSSLFDIAILPAPALYLMLALVGLMLGSFASALAWRIPRGESWSGRSRSRCPACDHVLNARDLLPLFSWVLARGRCRYCGANISAVYPLIESAAMVGALLLYIFWGLGWPLLILLAALPFLLALLVIDIRHMILPDSLNVILGALFILLLGYDAVFGGAGVMAFTGGIGAALVYAGMIFILGWLMEKFLRRDALGLGDVKFFAVAGLGLGLSYLPFFLILSGVLGVMTGIVWQIILKKQVFPFGPAIILAFFACLLLRGAGFVPLMGAY